MTKYFEQRLDEENLKSKKVAWVVAGGFGVISLILTAAIFYMLPLKMTDVKVLVVDKNTGYPTEITSLAKFAKGDVVEMRGKDALNKMFAQQYITLHDSYDHYSVRDAYSKVQLFSTKEVFDAYKTKFAPPVDIEKKLGDKKVLDIDVISLSPQQTPTPFKSEDDGVTITARISKTIREGADVLDKTTGMVTMTFGYDAELEMDEKARNINPFGFTVTSYRFDPDQKVMK